MKSKVFLFSSIFTIAIIAFQVDLFSHQTDNENKFDKRPNFPKNFFQDSILSQMPDSIRQQMPDSLINSMNDQMNELFDTEKLQADHIMREERYKKIKHDPTQIISGDYLDRNSDSVTLRHFPGTSVDFQPLIIDINLPVINLTLNELNNIVPESYENGTFNLYIDFITTTKELDSLRPKFNGYGKRDGEFIQRFRYPNGYYKWDSTRFNSGIPVGNGMKDLRDFDKSLYMTFSDHSEGENGIKRSYRIESPMVSQMNLIKGYDTLRPESWVDFKNMDKSAFRKNMVLWDKLRNIEFDLKQELIPVKIAFKDYYNILWFYPTDEFISKLPERYRDDIAEQFELKKQLDEGSGLGEVCVQLNDKTDYFGICGEKRGAIKSIEFLSIEPNAISSKLELSEDRNLKIYISTLTGQIVHQESKSLSSNFQLIDILPTNELNPGPYFFVIETDKGELAIEKVFLR